MRLNRGFFTRVSHRICLPMAGTPLLFCYGEITPLVLQKWKSFSNALLFLKIFGRFWLIIIIYIVLIKLHTIVFLFIKFAFIATVTISTIIMWKYLLIFDTFGIIFNITFFSTNYVENGVLCVIFKLCLILLFTCFLIGPLMFLLNMFYSVSLAGSLLWNP